MHTTFLGPAVCSFCILQEFSHQVGNEEGWGRENGCRGEVPRVDNLKTFFSSFKYCGIQYDIHYYNLNYCQLLNFKKKPLRLKLSVAFLSFGDYRSDLSTLHITRKLDGKGQSVTYFIMIE
jgi:hypothetical protein